MTLNGNNNNNNNNNNNMRTTKYHIPSDGVTKETHFYNDAETVYHDIERFKDRLRFRNDEFDKLMEYYEEHRGVLDVYNRPVNGPRAMRANLGTQDETWYYLDGAGNKIWVRNLELDTSDPNCGAFSETSHPTGDAQKDRIVVVRIPKVRHHYNVQLDYRKKISEFDASYRLPQSQRTASLRQSGGQQHFASGNGGTQRHHPPIWGASNDQHVEEYIATQKGLAEEIKRTHNHDAMVWCPPASIEEAELRLATLKREAAEIEAQRKVAAMTK
ncbi:Hypothetical protein, putative [Bodo saltans]|uniref:Uncharacterized protein n=1 Tax=Bodo saltans TaxID=75058 RepID=A0A0S4JEJ5_BODSA|nr:Hypothetical protein, putative [Bodo saltans]|eukprot:CUG89798.1 Hypothetical protein, putative [Bodo saltans]